MKVFSISDAKYKTLQLYAPTSQPISSSSRFFSFSFILYWLSTSFLLQSQSCFGHFFNTPVLHQQFFQHHAMTYLPLPYLRVFLYFVHFLFLVFLLISIFTAYNFFLKSPHEDWYHKYSSFTTHCHGVIELLPCNNLFYIHYNSYNFTKAFSRHLKTLIYIKNKAQFKHTKT